MSTLNVTDDPGVFPGINVKVPSAFCAALVNVTMVGPDVGVNFQTSCVTNHELYVTAATAADVTGLVAEITVPIFI